MWASELATSRAAERVAAVAAAWRPDIVQIEFLPMAVFLDAVRSIDAPRVLVDHDAGLRPARDFDHLAAPLRRTLHRLDERAWRRLDRRAAARVDATVVFTERDSLALNRAYPRRTACIPLVLPARDRPLNPVGRPPWSVLFVGYFRHSPNADAATWLVRDILPRIRGHHPDAQLVLVGEDPPVELRGLEHEGVVTAGTVEDVSDYLDNAAVVVAPMRLGGGVRVKVLEALGAGKAVVATRLGADGIEAPEGVAILLADSAAEFASSVSALLGDEHRRGMLASAAYAWARERQTRDTTATRYHRLYAELLDSRRSRSGDPQRRRCAHAPADGADDVPTTS